MSDPLDAEDLTELIFLKTWERLPRIEVRHFRAWLYRVAHNQVVDHKRIRKMHEELPVTMPDESVELEKQFQQQKEIELVTWAIKKLDARLQEVIVCRFIKRMSHAETAQIMNLSESNVRVLKHRALQKLRTSLAEKVN